MTYKLTNVKKEDGLYYSKEGYLLKLKFCYENPYGEDVEVTHLSTQYGNKVTFLKSKKIYDVEAVYKKL